MKKRLISATLLLALATVGFAKEKPSEKYTNDWESLKNYQAPEWYEDAKFGLWPIWGVYSVPAFKGKHAAEWYGRWMYCDKDQSGNDNQGYATFLHHQKTYGDQSKFGYKDFIPQFTAENFDADAWAELCVDAGAKFITALAVFHDNFIMWDTETSKWNSVDMGPKRDIVAEVKEAAKKHDLKFGVSNHSGWNYCFYMWNHINGYDATDPANEDLYGNPFIADGADTLRMYEGESHNHWKNRCRGNQTVAPSERDLNRWLERTNELATKYSPDLYYFDWGFNIPAYESRRKIFGAHYYNNAIKSGQGVYGNPNVVLNYKSFSFKPGTAVKDFERGGMADIADMVWQTDDSIYDGNNWGYSDNVTIKPTNVIVDELMDIISKRGVLMLAVAPKADGTFPDDQVKFLKEIGAWLDVCGEAVYSTRPYKILGEISKDWNAPDSLGHKTYIGGVGDIRYTRSKDYKTLYATLLKWQDGTVTIKTLADLDSKNIKSVSLVGVRGKLDWTLDSEGLKVEMCEKPDYQYAYPIKIKFKKALEE